MPNRDDAPPSPESKGQPDQPARKDSSVAKAPLLLVTGANGFLGSRLCRRALERGMRVAAMTRDFSDLTLLQPLLDAYPDDIERRVGDMTREKSHAALVADCDFVVNAAAATSEHTSDLALSRDVNVKGFGAFLRAAKESGSVRRVVHVSSQSAHPGNSSAYGKTKLESEATLKAAGLSWTILRPGVIYGPEERGVFSKLEKHVEKLPVIPVIGSGRYKQFPVHVDDVANAALDCLDNDACDGKTFDLGGRDSLEFLRVLDVVMAAKGARRAKLKLPVWICRIIASVGSALLRNPPLTPDNIEGLLTAPPLDNAPAIEAFGYAPRAFEEGFRGALAERAAAGAK